MLRRVRNCWRYYYYYYQWLSAVLRVALEAGLVCGEPALHYLQEKKYGDLADTLSV